MDQQLIKVPILFKDPAEYFRAKRIRKTQEHEIELRKISLPQEEFFRRLRKLIYDSRKYGCLLFFGYDVPFMERNDTLDTIKETLRERTPHYRYKTPVCAIVNEKDDVSALENLADETRYITLFKTPENIVRGFIVYGRLGVSIWDSAKKTYYPSETDKGIYREVWESMIFADKLAKEFEKKEKQLRVVTR